MNVLSKTRSQFTWTLLALCFVFCVPLPAQSLKSSVPVLGGTDAELGLALVNPTLVDAAVTLTARSYDGSLLQDTGIVNPVSLQLPALSQKALMAAQIFGQAIAGKPGWIELTLPAPAIRGFFLLFDAPLSFIDGTDLISKTSSRLLFPNASPSSILSFVNTGTGQLSVSAALYDNGGNLFRQQQLTMAPLSGFSGSVDTLIPGISGFEGYVVLDSSNPLSSQGSLVGIESFKNKSDIAVVKALQKSDQLRSGYIAHLVTQGQYTSTLTLLNPDPVSQSVLITAGGLQVGGQPMTPSLQTIQRMIPPYGRLAESVDTLFGFTTQPLITGYIHYEVTTATSGLIGYLAYGTTDGTALAAVSAQGNGYSDLFFAHLAQGLDYYTGLAILNPNADPAVISLNTFDGGGKQTGTKVLTLGPGEHRARLFSELLGNFEQLGGYARLSANRPVFAYELFGSQSSLRFLAAVPAQGVWLNPQNSGSVVASTDGAQVLSMDGLTSLIVPPGALPADATVEVATLMIENFPEIPAGQNGGNQAPIGNVELKPIDAQPKTPLPVIFPIRVQLKPGTQVPMFIYNASTKDYAPTNLFASVDELGRAVSAQITQLGTYVVGLSRDAILPVIMVNPNIGLPGTIINISGSGFSANPTEDLVTFAGKNNSSVPAKVIAAGPTLLKVSVPAGAATGSVMVTVGRETSFGVPFVVASTPPLPVPAFTFSPSSPVTGSPVSFDASASVCSALPCSYVWTDDADGSQLGTGAMISFTFTQTGTKNVRLTITDANSQTASVEHDVIVSAPSTPGTAYYVSNTGNDSNSGMSQSSPWKTIAKVQSFLANLQPGDRILFQRGGIWYEELDVNNVNGASGSPITFGNYGAGNLPIIDGGGTISGNTINGGRQWCIGGSSSKMSYLIIDGFECRNTSSYGITFVDVSGGSAGIVVQNCYIHDTGNGDTGYYNQLMFAEYRGGGNYGTKYLNNKVGNCYGHNCIQIHGDRGSPLIQGNECYGFSHNCIDVKLVQGAVVDGNVVHDGLGTESYENAFYIENSTTSYGGDVTWTRNVVYGSNIASAFQCQQTGGAVSCRIYNNTAYSGKYSVFGGSDTGNFSLITIDVKNNIFEPTMPLAGGGNVTWDYNDNVQSSPIGTHDLRVDPMFVNPGANDFHLQPLSPVVGKGVNVNLPFAGSAPDLGAFQFGLP